MSIKPPGPSGSEAHPLLARLQELEAKLERQAEEHKKLVRELEEKSGLLETVLQQMPAAVIVGEAPSGRLFFANPQIKTVWRHDMISSKNIAGYSEWVAFHPDGSRYKGEDWPLARAIAQGAVVKNEDTDVLRGDGTRGVLRLSAAPVKDKQGKVIAGVVICEDVTEQKRAEERLRTSEERYRVLADAIPTITWILDAQGNARFFNRRWYEYTGTDPATGFGGGWMPTVHPDDLPLHVANRTAAIARGEAYEGEFRIRAHDGQYRWFETRVVPLKGHDGRVLSWYGSAVDIDARKRAERELIFAKEAAENAARLKSQFLANMSHEIRTPMNAILGFGDLLTEEGLTEAEGVDFSTRIKSNGRQLLRIIDDILDISKLEAGKVAIERLACDLAAVFTEVTDTLRPLAEKKSLELRLTLDTQVPQLIQSDPTRLKQILLNVIGNAIKFTAQGSIEVRLAYVSPSFSGSLSGSRSSERGGSLRVEIEDTGIGIDPARQCELFQPFGQADCSITREFGGTGLGLVLSQRLAQALGGGLALTRSEPGVGSCFTLTLDTGELAGVGFLSKLGLGPRTELLTVRREVRAKATRLGGKRVLLVEDAPDGEALATLFLRLEGAEVEVARDGFEAIEKSLAASFDVVLMDIQMPRLDGLSATRQLRTRGYTRPIIALTAHALREEVDKSLQAGCDDHLTKPINRELLVAAINRITSPLDEAAER